MHVSSCSAAREAALAYLYGRINYEQSSRIPYRSRHFKLDRMRHLLQALGNPQQSLPVVHIAGTKGKGSTAAFVSSILRAAGYRTGVYTSPHLERLEERFVIDGQPCEESELVELVESVRAVAERSGLDDQATYFELTTAMAWLHFQRRQADIGVLEVGLGGRLDSTNVCHPVVTAITSISLDHQQQLGSTIPEIAGEKAGIIKSGVPVVSGVRQDAAREVIRRRALQLGSPLRMVNEDFFFDFSWQTSPAEGTPSESAGDTAWPFGRGCLDFRPRTGGEMGPRQALPLGLLGEHQACNAATSLAIIDDLRRVGWSVSEEAERHGLAAANCPARIEVASPDPLTIIDGAHNVASCEALLSTLRTAFPDRRINLVFATSQDKDAAGMLRVLLPHCRRAVVTRFRHNPRATDPARLLELAGEIRRELAADHSPRTDQLEIQMADDPEAAWEAARSHGRPDELLCVTGSFFLASELRRKAQALASCGESSNPSM